MKVNSNSWHYKLLNHVLSDSADEVRKGSVGLCEYFWKVCWSAFLGVGIIALAIFFSFTLVAPLLYWAGVPLLLDFVAVGVFWYAIAGMCLSIAGVRYVYLKWSYRVGDRPPSLLMERIKAHKAKVCPLIEFEEE